MSESIHLNITGMSCKHCVAAVHKALAAVDGVREVQVDLATGSAKVQGKADTAELIAAVKQAGYEAGV